MKLCDMCGECKNIDSQRSHIIRNKRCKTIEVEGRTPDLPIKIMAVVGGEHLILDLDLKIPDVVNEEVILENIQKVWAPRRGNGLLPKVLLTRSVLPGWWGIYTQPTLAKKHTYASDLPHTTQIVR